MKSKTVTVLILALVGIAVFGIHLAYFHTGVDYHYTFRPAVQGWLHGQAIYTPPFYGFFNAPWLVLFLTPLEWLTDNGAEAGLMLLTIAGLVAPVAGLLTGLPGLRAADFAGDDHCQSAHFRSALSRTDRRLCRHQCAVPVRGPQAR